MTRDLPRLGVRLPNSGPFATSDNLFAVADAADRLGFEDVWVHDHVSWAREKLTHFAAGSIEACGDQDPNFFESVTTLAVFAGRLPRAGLGVAGLVLPLRDPRVLGKQISTMDRLAGGRAITIAIGSGAIPNDFEVMGVPWHRRGRFATDHMGALRTIFENKVPVEYESPSLTFEGGEFYPVPRNTRLWAVGDSDPAIDRAVRLGDGWLTAYKTEAEFQERAERIRATARESQREMSSLTLALETFVTVGPTEAEARKISLRSLQNKFKTEERGLAVTMVGDPDGVLERIAGFAAAGADYIELKFICHDAAQLIWMLEQIAAGAGLTNH